MIRRTAATLVEVLVAIFVMAIGMLSLLTLFPLGALSMAQAIKDSRTGHASANANALAKYASIRTDSNATTGPDGLDGPPQAGSPSPPPYFVNGIQVYWCDPSGPSYPVFVDPVGVRMFAGTPGAANRLGAQVFPAGAPVVGVPPITRTPGIGRVDLSFLSGLPAPYTLRSFTLLDDMKFLDTGVPAGGLLNIEREGRYSWAYLVKRPISGNAAAVALSIVVYSQRPLQVNAVSSQPTGERSYRAMFLPYTNLSFPGAAIGSPYNVVQLFWNPAQEEKPAVKKGSWILDITGPELPTTNFPLNGFAPPNERFGTAHGKFYRVVGVTDVSPTTVEVELQTNLEGFARNPPSFPMQPGVVVVMENVVEVFEKGQ